MRLIKNTIRKLLFLAILFLSLNVYADVPKCNIADLDVSGIADEIKRNIIYFSVPPENCAGCASSIIPILDCQSIVEHKFLMIAQLPASSGGENVYIAIDSEPMRYFKLWMYPRGGGTYQMRFLKEVTIKAEEEFFVSLKSNYSELWQGF